MYNNKGAEQSFELCDVFQVLQNDNDKHKIKKNGINKTSLYIFDEELCFSFLPLFAGRYLCVCMCVYFATLCELIFNQMETGFSGRGGGGRTVDDIGAVVWR
jgi:hypothetical protein